MLDKTVCSIRLVLVLSIFIVFMLQVYKINILESVRYPEKILTVKANDLDASITEEEIKRGYGVIRFSLIGENSNLFIINNKTGEIQVTLRMIYNSYFTF